MSANETNTAKKAQPPEGVSSGAVTGYKNTMELTILHR
jgi:hypothetical protein